jgi:hypothetical protein
MSKLPREFYRRIGEKGGRNGKWSIAKRESARNAAKIRWGRIPRAAQGDAKHD